MTRVVLLLIASTALAGAEPLPVRNRGGSCPHGYQASGSFCIPSAGAQTAIAKPPGGSCPWGWLASGTACVRSGR
jgi:hypothetical protein